MKKRLIYYDLETTGVKSDEDRIIEIAAFDPIKNESFCEFVNPQQPIPAQATAISNITDEMVQSAPPFSRVLQDFIAFCGDNAVLCAHNNENFDRHFLAKEAERAHTTLPTFTHIDSLIWARKYRPDLPKHNLQYLREIYNIPANQAHRALDDVMVLYKIFSIMIQKYTALSKRRIILDISYNSSFYFLFKVE